MSRDADGNTDSAGVLFFFFCVQFVCQHTYQGDKMTVGELIAKLSQINDLNQKVLLEDFYFYHDNVLSVRVENNEVILSTSVED